MKLKTKVSVILIFLVIAVCSLFAACKIGGKTWQEILGDAQYQYITYYAAGGTFNNNKVVKDIYYSADTPTVDDFDAINQSVTRTDWLFKSWYYVELDEDGNPVFETEEDRANGNPVLTDREVQFPLILEKGEHLYLGATWAHDYKLKYFLYDSDDITIEVEEDEEGENGETIEVKRKVTVKEGEVITERNFGTVSSLSVSYSNLPATVTDATLLEYYVLNEDNEYVPFTGTSVRKPDVYDENDPDPYVAVYCKFISGIWDMVRTASDVRTMYQQLATGNHYYITQDIDCSTNTALTMKAGNINCIIEGNGHTISNQKFQANNIQNGTTYSVFGNITKDTQIKDITFENFEATVSLRSGARVDVYLFSHGMEEGAVLQNVTFNNSSLIISALPSTASINNIPKTDGGYQTDGWLFGEGNYDGLDYKNLTLSIDGQTDIKNKEN
ncbi:MAG: hypothetical protein K2H30_05985 [Clostridia bacterium]|nr:hypothetical protein [Clostridia bacterium]